MLATLSDTVPTGPGWLFEVKWDGYRALARLVAGEGATLASRRGNDLTERFRSVASALPRAVRSPDCVLDGEVCALDDRGRSSFSLMQQGKPDTPIAYFVFDVLEIEGEPVIDLPLTERRARLEALLDRRNRTVRLSEAFDDGPSLFKAAEEQQLEGIMAKKAASRYLSGKRTRDWQKIKTHGRQEFVICGYTKGQGRRSAGFGALILGVYRGRELRYVGNVGTGFTEAEIDRLLEKLRPLERAGTPFARGAEDAARPPRRSRVGRAEARVRGLVQRVDARRASAPAGLPGAALRQGAAGRSSGAAGRERDLERRAPAEALEPRQGLLAGRRHHEGRPARLLP